MNTEILVKQTELTLENFGIATKLPERLLVRLENKRKSFEEEIENSDSYNEDRNFINLNSNFAVAQTFCLVVLVSLFFSTIFCAISALFYKTEITKCLILGGLAVMLFFSLLTLHRYFARKHFCWLKKKYAPEFEKINSEFEQSSSRLSSDRVFLLSQTREFINEEKDRLNLEMQQLDRKIEEQITTPLTNDTEKLVRWQENYKIYCESDPEEMPHQPTLMDGALRYIEKYKSQIAETEALAKAISRDKEFVSKRIKNLENVSNSVLKLEKRFGGLDSAIDDFRIESGSEEILAQSMQIRRRSAREISQAFSEVVTNISEIEEGLDRMICSLPEVEKFGSDARIRQLAA